MDSDLVIILVIYLRQTTFFFARWYRMVFSLDNLLFWKKICIVRLSIRVLVKVYYALNFTIIIIINVRGISIKLYMKVYEYGYKRKIFFLQTITAQADTRILALSHSWYMKGGLTISCEVLSKLSSQFILTCMQYFIRYPVEHLVNLLLKPFLPDGFFSILLFFQSDCTYAMDELYSILRGTHFKEE